jgi:DNA adenine methylase
MAPRLTRPALRFLGGKWRLASWIIECFPPHTTYVEPFAGAASVFLRKPPSTIEIINDLDEQIVNFFEVLRSRPDELIRAIKSTPYSRKVWEQAYQIPAGADALERALALYIRCAQSFDPSSALSYKSLSWRRQKTNNRGKSVINGWREVDHLYAVAERLKQAQIECRPATDLIRELDGEDVLFYVDPPYVPSTRAVHDTEYRHELTEGDHAALLELLKSLRGMVVLSGYPNALYDEVLCDWWRREQTTTTNGHGRAVEVLWVNTAAVDRSLPLFNYTDAAAAVQEED